MRFVRFVSAISTTSRGLVAKAMSAPHPPESEEHTQQGLLFFCDGPVCKYPPEKVSAEVLSRLLQSKISGARLSAPLGAESSCSFLQREVCRTT